MERNVANITRTHDCCGSILGGTCADGSLGSSCCGRGGCNMFCCACDGGCREKPPSPPSAFSTRLIEWPMIMSHDSATSYYSGKTCQGLLSPESNWVMTQSPGTWTGQLNCGSRAFDLRLLSKNGELIAHHGPAGIKVKVSDLLAELKAWLATNPRELVVVYGSHCSGDDCQEMFRDALRVAGVPLLNSSQVSELTLGSALKMSPLLAVKAGCVQENYDPSIMCYKQDGESTKSRLEAEAGHNWTQAGMRDLLSTCHGADSQRFFNALWKYVGNISNGQGTQQSQFWMVQAHWQNDASSIAQGSLTGSCILKDESAAGVNSKLAHKISEGEFPHINLLELDNVCDPDSSGLQILAALRNRFTMDLDTDGSAVVV